jgi:eukaryotic-like serine/threonine-protein kinase
MKSKARIEVSGYQVMEYLGSGARSTIWRVRERDREVYHALKRVTKNHGDDERFLNQAINEFEIARQFDHPNIRKYFALRPLRKWFRLYELHLIMELCEGCNCQAARPTDPGETVRIFQAVAGGLAHMHARGYIHGDMKPNNIIVANDGTVKVIDFGQSCPMGTVKERIQGTPDFIAPEQVHRRPLDGRTDVFNFGAALYWVLTGQAIPTVLPKNGDTVQLVNDLRVTPVERLNEAIPPALSRLVHDCIAVNPTQRAQSMKEVGSRLDLISHTLRRNGNGNGNAAPPPADASADESGQFEIPPDLLEE